MRRSQARTLSRWPPVPHSDSNASGLATVAIHKPQATRLLTRKPIRPAAQACTRYTVQWRTDQEVACTQDGRAGNPKPALLLSPLNQESTL